MVHPLWTLKKNKRIFFSIKIHRSSPGDGPESDGNPLINHFTSTESMGRLIDGPFNRFVSFFFSKLLKLAPFLCWAVPTGGHV